MATDMTDIRVYAHWPGMTEPEWNAMETATRAGNSFSAMASASGFTWSFRSTAAKYFGYCKVACLNSHLDLDEKTRRLPGIELYKLFADGRHEGLTEIEPDSVDEFRDWMEGKHPKRRPGGHPWEILRGGNTTHILLYVSKRQYGADNAYEIKILGNSIIWIAETLKIYLGLMGHQLTVALDEPEKIRKRLLGQDHIGIVPEYLSLHRAQNLFDGHIDDVMHLYAFGKAQREVCRLAAWREVGCLRPSAGV